MFVPAGDEKDILDIIKEARKKDIFLFLEEGKLKFRTKTKIDPEDSIFHKLAQHKEDIKHLLSLRTDNGDLSDWTKINSERLTMRRIPLSFSQERLWIIDHLEGSTHYHIPWVLRVKGPLNKAALEPVFKDIVNRHEVLRTIFLDKDGMNYQQVMSSGNWHMERIAGRPYAQDSEGLSGLIVSLVDAPFDLSRDYMLRVTLIEDVCEQENILIINVHHIASDGWSWGIFVRELGSLFEYHTTGREPKLLPLPIQYADYAIWQRNYLQGAVLEEKLHYWRQKLSNVAPLSLPLDYLRPLERDSLGGSIQEVLDEGLSKELKMTSQAGGVTLFMTLLAAFKVLLYRYSGQEDICVGTPIAGRTQQETEGIIGFFINTLVLRTDLGGNPSFRNLLQSVRHTTLEAYEHQDVPFAKVVEAVVKERDLSRSPLFQVMFVMQNAPEAMELSLGEGVSLTYETPALSRTKADLTVTVFDSAGNIGLYMEYRKDLFNLSTIEQMMTHYKTLLVAAVESPETPICELKMLTDTQRDLVLKEFNDTAVNYPRDKTLVDLFGEQRSRTPEQIAVVCGNRKMTYRELDERSNQLGHYLRSRGVKEETLIPICIERSTEMIIGIWGILKAGGAYVPIDPEYPAQRISYMLEDTSASLLLSSAYSREAISGTFSGEVLSLDEDWAKIAVEPPTLPETLLKAENLAYVIYTSGSTGKPKGVLNQHNGVVNRLLWAQDRYHLGREDNVLQKTTFCFDVSVWELIWPLLVGSKLVFAHPVDYKDPGYLKEIIRQENISFIHFVPSMLELFLTELQGEQCRGLKKVLCSGEALKSSQVALFFEKLPGVELHNLYGPTEAAIDVTSWSPGPGEVTPSIVPIGKPVANTAIYILTANHSPAPVGVTGDIYIAGIQVARGYLNRPGLTAERFIKDPFSPLPGDRMYHTGDQGRWLRDGNIEYLGRVDDQVKIRGYRIEPGEIENMACQSGLVKQCVVLAEKDNANNYRLAGYVVAEPAFVRDSLIKYLQQHLPEYMVPRLWVTLETIPLTSNGKVDKRALPKAEAEEMRATTGYVAPRNTIETDFAAIWQEVLGIDRIGINEDFFSLGGHSLLIIRIVHHARQQGYHLLFKNIFQYPTIEKLADHFLETKDARIKALLETKVSHSHVIALNDCHDGLPLFMLPGTPGFCIPYEEFGACLGNTYKVYGIQMPGLREGEKKVYVLEEIAALCIKWIREIQPEGPYRFIGHSFGGYIAYEMSKQLERENEIVDFVCFLDVRADASRLIDSTEENILHNVCDFLLQNGMLDKPYPDWAEQLRSEIQDFDEGNQLQFVLDFVKKRTPESKGNTPFMWMVLETVIIQSQMRYRPSGKLNAGLLVVKAEGAGGPVDDYQGWEYFSDNVKKLTTPGEHTTMIKGDNAEELAFRIKEVMSQKENKQIKIHQ